MTLRVRRASARRAACGMASRTGASAVLCARRWRQARTMKVPSQRVTGGQTPLPSTSPAVRLLPGRYACCGLAMMRIKSETVANILGVPECLPPVKGLSAGRAL